MKRTICNLAATLFVATGYSIAPPDAGRQIRPFESAVELLLKGRPVGFALKDFKDAYAVLATDVSDMLERIRIGDDVSDSELVER